MEWHLDLYPPGVDPISLRAGFFEAPADVDLWNGHWMVDLAVVTATTTGGFFVVFVRCYQPSAKLLLGPPHCTRLCTSAVSLRKAIPFGCLSSKTITPAKRIPPVQAVRVTLPVSRCPSGEPAVHLSSLVIRWSPGIPFSRAAVPDSVQDLHGTCRMSTGRQ